MAESRLPSSTAVPGARLWTPWRMRYVTGRSREEGCIFCNRLAGEVDVQSLILHRGAHAFVIMNLYPYNTGHVMIVPNVHVASPEDAAAESLAEMATLRVSVLRALRRALSPEGFNLGLNVGAVAGAGVDDHFHEHVVPRWQGDANFMPILASTMVMPELIPVTYAKLRAEMEREIHGCRSVISVVLTDDQTQILLDNAGRLPRAEADADDPLWLAALRDVQARGAIDTELLGWAGSDHADRGPIALLFRSASRGDEFVHVTAIGSMLPEPDGEIVRSLLGRLQTAG
jgi:ATP adenylyltransferase